LILEQIVISNFGIYKGEHTVQLKPEDSKPIILFGAFNGSGKTTFLEALQLVLYGKSAKTVSRGGVGYEDYLESLINRDTPKSQGAGLSLTFTSRQNGKHEQIKVTRTWFKAGNKIKENCEVLRNGEFDQVASERWNEFVEEFMPSQISELFFFDGEKIEGLADPARSSNILRSGIYSLLGVNAIDNLIKSLIQIEKKKTLEGSKDDDKDQLVKEEVVASDLARRRDKIITDLANLQNAIDKNLRGIETVESELKVSGADLFLDRHNLQEKQTILKERSNSLKKELIDISGGLAPLLLVKTLITELRQNKTNASGFNKQSLELLKNEYAFALQSLKEIISVDQESIKAIEKVFGHRVQEINVGIDEYQIDIALSEIPDKDDLSIIENEVIELLSITSANELDLDRLNQNLAAVPSEDKFKVIVDELNEKQAEKNRNEGKYELLKEELDEIENEQAKISKIISSKLLEIATKKTGSVIAQRVLNHSARARETLIQFKGALLKKHVQSLSDQITACFRQLHRKAKLELTFKINIKDFSLSITKANGDEVSSSSLSAGERQLLAVAILWALAKSSGKELPTVIDTPLGRLDGPHREKLISNYFPMASAQVLIFSTDEEISASHYKTLKPFIAKEYKINYNEDTESSGFEVGYF
jgi:DNA sulfur modification protein DndD